MTPADLDRILAPFRTEADRLARRGLHDYAKFAHSLLSDVRERVEEWWIEELTLTQAAAESGHAYSTLQQRVADGTLPNAGETGRPRIRRCDLPAKPKPRGPTAAGGQELADEILARTRGGL